MTTEATQAQQAALELCRQHPEGVPEASLIGHFPSKETAWVVNQVINKLLTRHQLQVYSQANGGRAYKAFDETEAAKRRGLSEEDVLVLQEIGKTTDKGIWSKDLKRRTGLGNPAVQKALKNLEGRNLIKAVKTVQHGNRKHFMLFELEPSVDITGGIWYEGAEFDTAMVNLTYQLCLKCVEDRQQASAEQACAFVNTSGVLKDTTIQQAEIDSVLAALVYDRRIERVPTVGQAVFKPSRGHKATSAFASIPCGVCPVINECTPHGHISPQACVYFDAWLDF
ncbi:hypothetical protein WJX73_009296 [Symbiochloris irregularis]|uniref:DNA-directed RNA polymerase III subunit RPC6 n=1 Tax=Symbiochloris irregularis TaxID=706552 RepID=A0AAW1NV19_9CHLO